MKIFFQMKIFIILFFWINCVFALDNNELNAIKLNSHNFLSAENAFKFNIFPSSEEIQLIWQIAPSYYLYSHAFKITLSNKQNIKDAKEKKELTFFLKPSIRRVDEYFGTVDVYYNQAEITLDLRNELNENESGYLIIEFQGCAEAGLCYPIQKKVWDLKNKLLIKK